MNSKYSIDHSASEILQHEVKTPIIAHFDVIIAGGGVAGFPAAISASRAGANTCLVERFQVIGGTATSGLMNLFYTPYDCSRGIVRELFDRLIAEDAATATNVVPFDPEICKIVMLEMLEKAQVTFLLDTLIVDAVVNEDEIIGLIVENKSGRQALLAKRFVDATGDADVGSFAGVPFIKGRELDNKMRPMTLLFMVSGIDVDKLVDYVVKNPQDFSPDPNKRRVDVQNEDIRLLGSLT